MTTTQPLVSAVSFGVSCKLLHQALSRAQYAIKNQPIVPILENVLCVYDQSGLSILSSDLQTYVHVRVPEENIEHAVNLKKERDLPQKFILPIRPMLRLLAALPEQLLGITYQNNEQKLIIQSASGRYEFNVDSWLDFPKLPNFKADLSFSLPASTLRGLFNTAYPFLSTDDLRPAMTGVYWEYNAWNSRHTLAATDGHRLIRSYLQFPADNVDLPKFNVIIPRDLVRMVVKMIPVKPANLGEVKVELSQDLQGGYRFNIRLSWGNYEVIGRLIDERFPDYQNAMPASHESYMEIDRKDLIGSVKRALIFANRATHTIAFHARRPFTSSTVATLEVSATDLDYGQQFTERLSVAYTGEAGKIGMNAVLLLEILAGMTEQKVRISFDTPNRAMLIHGLIDDKIDESATRLLMPTMLNDLNNYA